MQFINARVARITGKEVPHRRQAKPRLCGNFAQRKPLRAQLVHARATLGSNFD
jgi:hypothetical protein